MRNIILTAIFSLCAYGFLSAQTKSSQIETINGERFYIHSVQSKETFYGLSRVYGVSIDDIQRCNDNLKSLSVGQQIRIPVVETAEESKYSDGQIITKNGKTFIVHNVQQGETVYALARKYEVSAGQIIAENPAINNAPLSIGQQLFIPFSGKTTDNPAPATQTETKTNEPYFQYPITKNMSLNELAEQIHTPKEVIKLYNPSFSDSVFAETTAIVPLGKLYFPKGFIFCFSSNTTLNDIAEKYNVSLSELLHYNSYGIVHFDEGVYIRVPINNENQIHALEQINARQFLFHTVEQGETTYSITHKYHISEEELLANNPMSTLNALPVGYVLRIPYKDNFFEYIPENQNIATENQYGLQKNNMTITMMLPFFLNKNANTPNDGIINKPKEIYEHTYQFLEYYEGALLALDSLKRMGMSITLNVIESNNDSATTNINRLTSNTDLIIGPVFPKTFPAAAAYAKRHSIPIVSPLSTEETNTSNPFVIQMNTPQKYRFKAMVNYIIKNNENCHVCIVYNSESLEKKLMTQCKMAFNEQKPALDGKKISFEEMYYPSVGLAGLDKAMTKKPKTIIVVLSKQPAFANNIVTKLFQSSKNHNIELWGMPQWERYENIELDFLFDLNFKLVTSGEVDYSSPRVNAFIKQYRKTYNTEPTKFSFQGFDQMLFLVKHYATGTNFIADLQAIENENGLHDSFNFIKKDGSCVNTTSFIVEYDKATFSRKTSPAAIEVKN